MVFINELPPASPRAATPSPYNSTAWAQLTDAVGNGQAIEAILLEYEPDGQEEKLAWGFLINPVSLDIENSASYGEVAPHATSVTSSQYSHTSGQTFTTPSMMFSLWCCKKSARVLLDGLKKLMEADPKNGRYAPPLLRFSWGSFNMGPLSLIKYSYKITAVLDGEPADVRDLTLTFKEQPRPLTQAEQEALAQERLQQQILDRAAAGAPKLPLTERQQTEAHDRAEAFLARNLDQFSADVQAAIRSKEYFTEVGIDDGVVSLLDKDRNLIGFIAQYNGTNHTINRNLFTVPLREGGKIGDGTIGKDGAIVPATATPAATTTTTTTQM